MRHGADMLWKVGTYEEIEGERLDDGWPESEKDVFQAALRMVVVKDSRWIVGEFLYELWKDMVWKSKVDQGEDTW